MAVSKSPYHHLLSDLASLLTAVAGESVTMVKRNAPEQSLTLKRSQEWTIYLEFLKGLFTLVDRLSALYIPLRDQPLFMDSLEDAVTSHLRSVLAPALGPGTDPMEVTMTIGTAVAESRQEYERFKFLPTESGKEKDAFFQALGERVAQLVGASGNGQVISAAVLCVSAAISAMQSALDNFARGQRTSEASQPEADAAPSASTAVRTGAQVPEPRARPSIGNEIKLVSVMASVAGEEVETRWGLHPRFRQDLSAQERQEITRLMNRVAQILGERYAAVAFSPEWANWKPVGNV